MKKAGYCISLIASFLLCSTTALHAQGGPPVNDHCEDVTPVALALDSTIVFTGNTVGATNDGDNAPGSGLEPYGNMAVVWVAFTTTGCADVAISFCGSSTAFMDQYFWEVLTPQCPADQLIATTDYNNSECPDGQPVIHHHDLPAGTYYYPVWADQDDPIGDYVITISATACASAGPVNDVCSGAVTHSLAIGDTLAITGDNTGATDGEGLGFASVWESFTLSQCANVTVDYCGTTGFSEFAYGIYSDCPATTLIDTTAADSCTDGNLIESFEGLAPGTYWIPVLQSGNSTGAYALNVTASACAGPSNNYCSGAVPHDLAAGDTLVISGDNTGATDGEGLGFASVWESFTLAECADVTIDYCSTTGFSTFAYGIYSDCPAITLIDTTAADSCTDGNLVEYFEGLAPGTYWIPVLMADSAEGAYTINVTATACTVVVTPPNDSCADAVPHDLAAGDTLVISGDNTGATDGEGLGFASVWESFTLAECADVTIDYCGTTGFSAFAYGIYSDCPATMLIDTTAADSCTDGNLVESFEGLAPGTYWIPVLMADSAEGAYAINVTAVACTVVVTPPNDSCADAVPHDLAAGDTLVIGGDNTGATVGEGLGFASVWESFTLAECADVTIDYCSTTGFSAFAYGIYSDCPATTLIDTTAADSCTDGNLVESFEGLAPGTYWIPVLMADSAEGAYTINVTATACDSVAVPANDLCANAAAVEVAAPDSCATGSVAGDNTGATGTGDAPSCDTSATAWQDVWFSFHTEANTQVAIALTAGTIANAGMEVFPSCGDTAIACSIDGSVIDLAVLPDTAYLVRVFTRGPEGLPGTFELCITGDHTSGIRGMEQGALHIFPNPGTGDITLVPARSAREAVITILDMAGRPVHVERSGLIAGETHRISWDGLLKPGSYLLQIATPQGISIGRVMVK